MTACPGQGCLAGQQRKSCGGGSSRLAAAALGKATPPYAVVAGCWSEWEGWAHHSCCDCDCNYSSPCLKVQTAEHCCFLKTVGSVHVAAAAAAAAAAVAGAVGIACQHCCPLPLVTLQSCSAVSVCQLLQRLQLKQLQAPSARGSLAWLLHCQCAIAAALAAEVMAVVLAGFVLALEGWHKRHAASASLRRVL